LKAVQEGMKEVVEEGTATLAQVPGYTVAGKTGTAQKNIKLDGELKRDLKCWFYCYGPFEAPRYVTCVVVEGGVWGGTTTAPIAQEIMRRLFAMDKGAVETPTFLQPAIGNFNGATVDNSHPWDTATKPGDAGTDTSADNPDAPSSTPMPDAPPVVHPLPGNKRGH